jgi:predicted ATPase/DNA-binding winged helix-turn-helix (wHTH) protein
MAVAEEPDEGVAGNPGLATMTRSVIEPSMPGAPARFTFRHFEVLPDKRELLANGRPVRIGAKAFELLLGLLEAPGLIATRETLTARLWPKTTVSPNNLEVQVNSLRRALGGDRDVVTTAPGRGYRLTADVQRVLLDRTAAALSQPASALIGRRPVIDDLVAAVPHQTLITICGAGGMGKTRVALAVAQETITFFDKNIYLVELAQTSPSLTVLNAVAEALRLPSQMSYSVADLAAAIRSKPSLLVMDNCEHLIGEVALLVDELCRIAPDLHVLATSQEPLNLPDEQVYRLRPLGVPIEGQAEQDIEREDAVQLFISRFKSAASGELVGQSDLQEVAQICRRLDGVPLAIELAAASAALYGVQTVAEGLEDRFKLLNFGRRTAPDRHRTLTAILEWSVGLLTPAERAAFQRLSVFRGRFSLEAARSLISLDELQDAAIETCVAGLAAKSFLVIEPEGGRARYRLLETTRLYGWADLERDGKANATRYRHAEHYLDRLTDAGANWEATFEYDWPVRFSGELDQVRAALKWAFSETGNLALAIDLTIAASPLWRALSLAGEGERHARRALAAGEDQLAQFQELRLLSALAQSIVPTRDRVKEKQRVGQMALDLATALGDAEQQALSYLGLARAHTWDRQGALRWARAFRDHAVQRGLPQDIVWGSACYGGELMRTGALTQAEPLLAPIAREARGKSDDAFRFRYGIDGRLTAASTYALLLLLMGRPDQALQIARKNVVEAMDGDQSVSLLMVLAISGCVVEMLAGDRLRANANACHFRRLVGTRRLNFGAVDANYLVTGTSTFEELAGWEPADIVVRDGSNAWISRLLPLYKAWFGQHLAAHGRLQEAEQVLTEAIESSAKELENWSLAELWRIKAEIVENSSFHEAELCYRQGLALARQQAAAYWDLRLSLSFARLLHKTDRINEGADLVSASLRNFTVDQTSPDLRSARKLLARAAGSQAAGQI